MIPSIWLLSLVVASCDEPPKKANVTRTDWGKASYYSDFLFDKYQPDTLTKKLQFEFNETALDSITEAIALIVVKGKETATKDTVYCAYESEPAQDIVLLKNGMKCEENVLSISTEENGKIITLQIILPAGGQYEDETIHLGLRVKNAGGLDYIDNIDLEKERLLSHEWTITKDNVYNPMGLLLFWILVVIVTLLTACFIISRILNPSTKFSKLYIDYDDGAGEQRINMGHAYQLLCTNKNTRFSIFHKFFIGVVKVEVNDFWTHPVTIKSGTRHNVRISGLGEFELHPDETVRKEPFTIVNENGQQATITTA
ncbi:MAG: hypothetical protein LBS46_09210 [Dysgonamonadaceae bacterium]|nr:hypothetical protein [Dysgonamonadaceae bacterium]